MKNKNIHTYIESRDIGDMVLCDVCNKEYPASDGTSGGFLFGSYAYCPECAARHAKGIFECGEGRISEYCPKNMSYHDWVMGLRGGDNTIRVITKGLE